jgi:predicted ATP-dependent Lon-type protease
MDLPDGEDKSALVDEAIISLRKALASGGQMPKAQVEYVLGKAYFDKGDSYFDEAVKYLELSIAAGYLAADSREYLGSRLFRARGQWRRNQKFRGRDAKEPL